MSDIDDMRTFLQMGVNCNVKYKIKYRDVKLMKDLCVVLLCHNNIWCSTNYGISISF